MEIETGIEVKGEIMTVHSKSPQDPFWLPIEVCPKEQGNLYLIYIQSGGVHAAMYQHERGFWYDQHNRYPEHIITHYAEVPPLPKAQDEASA